MAICAGFHMSFFYRSWRRYGFDQQITAGMLTLWRILYLLTGNLEISSSTRLP